MKEYDFIVLGGGSAGYAAASTATRLGLKVAVIEGGQEVGGLCILRGCMPSKALIESANRYLTLRRAAEFGLRAEEIAFCFDEIQARKNRLISEFADYRRKQLESGRFEFYRGWAGFVDPHVVEVKGMDGDTEQVRGASFLIATGSRLKQVPCIGLQETGYLDSDGVLASKHVPKSVIVLGGGAIGIEFAHFYAALGSQVTILQRSEQILKEMDGDVALALTEALKHRGVRIYCHTQLHSAECTPAGLKRVTFQQSGKMKSVEAEEIVYALGREPQIDGLNLEQAGVDVTCGRLTVACNQQTNVPHIFAAGDVAGNYEVVHIAIQEGEVAARNAAKLARGAHASLEEIDYRLRLFAVFSSPEIATVGMTERELQTARLSYCVATYPFNDHGKSMVHGETEGFVKLLTAEGTGEIVGAAAVGPHASELIHEIVVAMRFHATAADLAQIPHYHPTLSEIWTYPAEELA